MRKRKCGSSDEAAKSAARFPASDSALTDPSERRAASVRSYLESQGIDQERLVPVGHGKNQPIASNKTEEGRQQNRRVEFRMTVKGEDQAFEKTR